MLRNADSTDVAPDPYYRAVFREAADGILILDDARTIVEANPAAAALLGVPADALVGCRFDDLIGDAVDQVHTAWRELMAMGEAKREHRIIGSDASERQIECIYRARVQDGRHLCIARDVTERRLLQERVMQSEKIESIGRLAGGIAHDFNNLLTAVLGYTELLLASRAPDDPDRHDLEEIQKAGHRAATLTHQLLAFSRKQMLVPKEVDLNQTVLGLKSMLSRLIREDITLTYDLAPAAALVRIDPHQIEQVILNLVLNARDALPGAGRITIEVACVPASQVQIAPEQSIAGDLVRLRITDSGTGMSQETRAHLFEPFFTTKELGRGTGLGLASVYGIVRQSNGFINVESEPGRGTTFTMYFPAVAPAEIPPERRLTHDPALKRETILLVEDEDAVRVIVGEMLRRHGYQVLEASTPHDACDIFEQQGNDVDLLLTDVIMPEMTGPALAQLLMARKKDLRVLFISGYANAASIPLDPDNPNVSFLAKPFQATALTGRVRGMLSRAGAL